MVDGVLLEAREAWARICRRGQTSFDDWVMIGKACAIGRAESLKKAGTNRPYGKIYMKHMAEFLAAAGLDSVRSQERYWALQIVDHLAEIERWRATIDDAARRRLNHPQSIWLGWKKTTRVNGKRKGKSPGRRTLAGMRGKPVFWGQDAIRRAADAMFKSRSTDRYILARAALEAAIRDSDDLLALIDTPTRTVKAATVLAPALT